MIDIKSVRSISFYFCCLNSNGLWRIYSTFVASSQLRAFIYTAIILSMFMLSFIFVIVCDLFEWKQICAGFISLVYICIVLEIQFPRVEGWVPIIRFNTDTCLCLTQGRTWIFNVLCRGLSCVQWIQSRLKMMVHFVYISEIVDRNYLNFLFLIKLIYYTLIF
jgi:hypothetical protein